MKTTTTTGRATLVLRVLVISVLALVALNAVVHQATVGPSMSPTSQMERACYSSSAVSDASACVAAVNGR